MPRIFKKDEEQKTGRQQQNENAAAAQFMSKNTPLFEEMRRVIEKAPAGFDLADTPLGSLLNAQNPIVFELKSGTKQQFKYEYIEHSDLMTATDVVDTSNGRDQANLTQENLAPVIRTFKVQQFYPAFGFRRKDGVIEIVDGSRRRMAAYFSGRGLIILVCEEELSRSDAQQLSKDLQTAVEHNLKERGRSWIQLNETMSAKEIAECELVSEATVSRGLKAGKVSDQMTSLVSDDNHLTTKNWLALYDIEHVILPQKEWSVADFLVSLKESLEEKTIECDDLLAYDRAIIERMKALANAKPKQSAKPTTKNIHKYNAQVSLRSKLSNGRFSIDTGKISQRAQKEIEEAVQAILDKHYLK